MALKQRLLKYWLQTPHIFFFFEDYRNDPAEQMKPWLSRRKTYLLHLLIRLGHFCKIIGGPLRRDLELMESG
jgi:hypothetical protein